MNCYYKESSLLWINFKPFPNIYDISEHDIWNVKDTEFRYCKQKMIQVTLVNKGEVLYFKETMFVLFL